MGEVDARTATVEELGLLMAGVRGEPARLQGATREPRRAASREAAQPAAVADGRRAARVAHRRAHRDRAPAGGDRPSADHDAATALRRRISRGRRAHEHADRRDAARVHGPRRRRRVSDAVVQHRRRGAALLRRDRRRRHRPAARGPVDDGPDRRDDRRRRGSRRRLGRDSRPAAGLPEHQRDHHLADAQLRRRARPQLPDLRQPLVLARHLAGGARLPAGQGARRRGHLAGVDARVARHPVRLRPRRRDRVPHLVPQFTDAVRVRGSGDRRLTARCALRRHEDAAQDRRDHGAVGRRRRHRRRQPDR